MQDKGHGEIYNHEVTLNCDRYTITDHDSIPTGQFQPVSGTDYDLRVTQNLGKAIARINGCGYDDNFCVTRGSDQSIAFVARYVCFSSSFYFALLFLSLAVKNINKNMCESDKLQCFKMINRNNKSNRVRPLDLCSVEF